MVAHAALPLDLNEVRGRLGAGTRDVALLSQSWSSSASAVEEVALSLPRGSQICYDFKLGRCNRGSGCKFSYNLKGRSSSPKGLRPDQSPRFRKNPGFASITQRAPAREGTSVPTSTSSLVLPLKARMSPLLRPLSLLRVRGGLTVRRLYPCGFLIGARRNPHDPGFDSASLRGLRVRLRCIIRYGMSIDCAEDSVIWGY